MSLFNKYLYVCFYYKREGVITLMSFQTCTVQCNLKSNICMVCFAVFNSVYLYLQVIWFYDKKNTWGHLTLWILKNVNIFSTPQKAHKSVFIT